MKFIQASIGRRMGAWLIDYIVVMVACVIYAIFTIPFSDNRELYENYRWFFITVSVIWGLLVFFYVPISESLFNGKTLGKKALGIRTVRADGSPASGIHCLQRFLLFPFDTYLTMYIGGTMSMMLSDKQQRIGDLAADCMVIQDSPQKRRDSVITHNDAMQMSRAEYEALVAVDTNPMSSDDSPMTVAQKYRAVEGNIAAMRTHKALPKLILYMERVLADMHVRLFQRQATTLGERVRIIFQSIPRAVYESRWYILCSLLVAVVAFTIGAYSQMADLDYSDVTLGQWYVEMTEENIANGAPTDVYNQKNEWEMFEDIFTHNLGVSLLYYVSGLIPIFGPIFACFNNFVIYGSFLFFFIQRGHGLEALLAIQQHGTIELLTIIVVCGAGLRLGTSWLFPGRRSRFDALKRGARQSLLVLASCIPMILIAAIIESFVTRHVEWPMGVRVAIIIVSFILFTGYYVVLPILSQRR